MHWTTEGRVTFIDGLLASAVLLGLLLNALVGWWRADPAAGYVLLFYATREGTAALRLHGNLSVARAEPVKSDARPDRLDDPEGPRP